MLPEQERALVGGGDCFLHWHSEDRRPTQDFLHGLQSVSGVSEVSGNITLTGLEDFVLVDAASNITVTLPRAKQGIEIEIGKRSGGGTLIIVPQGIDTILLASGVTISSIGTSIRFKAFGTDWRPI